MPKCESYSFNVENMIVKGVFLVDLVEVFLVFIVEMVVVLVVLVLVEVEGFIVGVAVEVA